MAERADLSIDLFSGDEQEQAGAALSWPKPERFPLNAGGHKVENLVWRDLLESAEPLAVAGYASLDRLIDLMCAWHRKHAGHGTLRLLFGHEPFDSRREEFRLADDDFTAAAERYWLAQGISLDRSAAVIRAIELLKSGAVHARYVARPHPLHAKIYCGEQAATLGSSNFTEPGLTHQFEANARFTRGQDGARFKELWQIAENYWRLGRDYRDALIALLQKLLQVVSWREALARACAEMLEGDWARDYLREDYLGEAGKLWPSQRQGIAQALAVLSSQDSVLIADATGAGKTRMGVYLIGAVRDDILRRGRMRRGNALMVCPPNVWGDWKRESNYAGVNLDVYSQGHLSQGRSKRHELTLEALRRAQILCVDEGHNFLNMKSNRSQHLLRNMADHVIMLTATPINRSVVDLLRIADTLGADNLEPATLAAFKKMLGVRRLSRTLTEAELKQLRGEIQKFTVRRTKRVLNRLIDREPERYTDAQGRPCRFPEHKAHVYTLEEPASDRAAAQEIRALADELRGLTHFVRPIEMPTVLKRQGVSEEKYLQGRLVSAAKLARYLVMSSLRSSRAALVEHALGTHAALQAFGIGDFKKDQTGDMRGQLENRAGRPPENRLSIALPDWLSEPEVHRRACEEDAARYARIAELARQLSDQREARKAELLTRLSRRHHLTLAFDSRPITLAVIRGYLNAAQGARALLAWGDSASDRDELLRVFAHGSQARGVIGLCSDSVSEGVNLQQAAALVHLDMPSVVRIAEQRAGRVDRMDSPHESIEVWWPDDAPEFALSSDERFIERYDTVDSLLGSNLPLPENLQAQRHAPVRAQEMIEEFERSEGEPWDGIDDAFSPVRSLVMGPRALVDPETYEHYRKVGARVLSRVSLVRAASPWAFFCLSAGTFGAPRWVLVPSAMGTPVTALSEVVDALRERVSGDVEGLPLDDNASRVLGRFLKRLPDVERLLLSRKKQRALEEMLLCLDKALDYAGRQERQTAVDHLDALRRMLRSPPVKRQPDWDAVAARWLDVIRPVWFERLSEPRRQKPLLLRDVRKDLCRDPEWLIDQFESHFRQFPILPDPERRVRACIVGVA